MSRRGAGRAGDAPGADPPADEVVARLASDGDPRAFATLVERYQEPIYRLCRRLTRSNADAEDALQETFLILMRRLRSFRGEAKFATWLYRIATNAALGIRRRQSRLRAESLEEFLPRFDARQRHAGPIEPFEAIDRQRLARRASALLERLPDRYRVPMVLRDLEEIETSQVAAILGLTEAAVRQRVHRARLMLRGYLASRVGAKGKDR